MSMAGTLCSVKKTPPTSPTSRLLMDSGENDDLYIVSVGPKFLYVIPSFDVLAVDLQVMRVQGYDHEGKLLVCDVFIRDDLSLKRVYPAAMTITDQTCIEVSYQVYFNQQINDYLCVNRLKKPANP